MHDLNHHQNRLATVGFGTDQPAVFVLRATEPPIGIEERLLDLGGGEPPGRVVEVVLFLLDPVEEHRRSSSVLHTD